MADETLYEEGHEYVVCPECRSHILLCERESWLDPAWDGEADPAEMSCALTCDWEECLADFDAIVQPPRKRLAGEADDGDRQGIGFGEGWRIVHSRRPKWPRWRWMPPGFMFSIGRSTPRLCPRYRFARRSP